MKNEFSQKLFFIIICLIFLGCSVEKKVKQSIIPKNKIREVSDSSITLTRKDENKDKLFIKKAIKIAALQAKEWDDSAKLILVSESSKIIDLGASKFKEDFDCSPVSWLFVYKTGAPGNASLDPKILAVTVDSRGIIDAGTEKCRQSALEQWPEIEKFKDIYSLEVKNSCNYKILVAIINPTFSGTVWISLNDMINWADFYDALTGERISDLRKILSERPKLPLKACPFGKEN